MVAAEMAVIDEGISLRFSARFRAVTTISVISSDLPLFVLSAFSSAAKDTVALKAPVIPNARVARPTRIRTARPTRNAAGRRTNALIITPPNSSFLRSLSSRAASPRRLGAGAVDGCTFWCKRLHYMHDRQISQVLQKCCGYETERPCEGPWPATQRIAGIGELTCSAPGGGSPRELERSWW